MATLTVQGEGPVRIATDLTGNVDTDIVQVPGVRGTARMGALVITSAIGATPTVTVNIRGSVDGVNWINIPYSAENTFSATWVTTALTITTAKTGFYVLQPGHGWRMLKLVLSANTNVTLTVDAYL
jgi:hypothetical protein